MATHISVPLETLHAIREHLRANLAMAMVKDEVALLRAFDAVQGLLVPGLTQQRLALRSNCWECIVCGATFADTRRAKSHTCPT
jgi:hypothetical protein